MDLVKTYQPDIVLLEMALPKISGYEVCKKIKNKPETKETTVIAYTGKVMDDEKQKAYNYGCDVFLPKPVSIKTLLEIVEQNL